ncbi:DNA methylase [Methanospirillum stamsii]|uniref:DNA methylase n=1 Tax=Methanospirillum stamsii TaxID=1277351 RepID=A0A2V2NHK5_9EURY|nr:DNA methylase [Methanospirillum stamsii]
MTKEILDSLRSIDGFPIGKDEDIIALSDPPFYTACPNPWIGEFIEMYGTPYDPNDGYNREPFSADVSEGKNDPIYMAHSYHTKVPHKAIMRYILHYTKPGDIVFDGFCGTGMTGVAAQMCGCPDPEFKEKIEKEMPEVEWGARRAILCDLSPAATFIAYNYNNPVDSDEFEREAKRILEEVKAECGWMYETNHLLEDNDILNTESNREIITGKIEYVVWSDAYYCPSCSNEFIYWDSAVDFKHSEVKKEFNCSICGSIIKKAEFDKVLTTTFDHSLNEVINYPKRVPVRIVYSVKYRNKIKKIIKEPDENDISLLNKIDSLSIPYFHPTIPILFKEENWGDIWRKGTHLGLTRVHHFYTKRNLFIISAFLAKIDKIDNKGLKNSIKCILTSFIQRNGYIGNRFVINEHNPNGRINGPLLGTLYIPALMCEQNILELFQSKFLDILNIHRRKQNSDVIIQTSSNSKLNIIENTVDYIFTDPPFGANIMYSEVNFLWESWLKVFTNQKTEAIINKTQEKSIDDYKELMKSCFSKNFFILKPNRWITIEFHNSSNNVWIAIQEAMQKSGFIIADVRILDKKSGTIKQSSTLGAVKQDLIISAYKPSTVLEQTFTLTAGTEEGVWTFIDEHLKHLPVVVEKEGIIETIAERQNYLLFDRMVAFHVQRGITVPISSAEFYAGLAQRYPERDTMYFLPEQVEGYDSARLQAHDVGQLSIFVHDERSAVQWLRQELATPQTYQEIQPAFLRQLHQDSHEALPELSDVLEENFLKDDQGKWYVPNPSKTSDLEKIRERSLLREFGTYVQGKGKLKLFRSEAVRAGFAKAWKERDYGTIVSVGKRLPPKVLQEDDQLLMYFDNAVMRGGE